MRNRFLPARRDEEFGLPSLFDSVRRMQEEMDRLMESFFGVSSRRAVSALAPRLDMYEEGDKLVVEAELPGVDRDKLEVRVYPDRLVLRAEKAGGREEKGESYYCCERSYGTVYREMALPVEVKVDEVKAEYRNGVLKVVMPKLSREEEQGRKVDVRFDE